MRPKNEWGSEVKWEDMKEENERTPLKTILQNFLNHVATLEAKKGERDDQYEKEFQVDF